MESPGLQGCWADALTSDSPRDVSPPASEGCRHGPTQSSSTTKAPKSAAPAGPDFTVTAGELIEEFEDKYLLDITDGGDFEILSVTCHDMDNDVLSELTVGDDITVIGNFEDGGDLGVDLEKCRVV